MSSPQPGFAGSRASPFAQCCCSHRSEPFWPTSLLFETPLTRPMQVPKGLCLRGCKLKPQWNAGYFPLPPSRPFLLSCITLVLAGISCPSPLTALVSHNQPLGKLLPFHVQCWCCFWQWGTRLDHPRCCWGDPPGKKSKLWEVPSTDGLEGLGMETLLLLSKTLLLSTSQCQMACIPGLPLNFLSKACPSRLAGRAAWNQAGRQAVDQLPKYLRQTRSGMWVHFPWAHFVLKIQNPTLFWVITISDKYRRQSVVYLCMGAGACPCCTCIYRVCFCLGAAALPTPPAPITPVQLSC